jgi:hypothetical protein
MKHSKVMKALSSALVICMILSMFAVITVSADNVLTLANGSALTIVESEGTKLICGFAEKKTVAELKSNFESQSEIIVSFNDSVLANDALVGTGTVVSLGDDKAVIIVKGDTNSDGVITSTDYLQIKNYFLGGFVLDGIFYLAADTDDDGEITTADYLQIKGYLLGHTNLYPESGENDSRTNSAKLPCP